MGYFRDIPKVPHLHSQELEGEHHDNQTQNPGHLRGRVIKTQAVDDDTADLYVLIARPQ